MPTIRSSAYLRNNYNEVSEFCNSRQEPMFITRNGHGDLAVMSIKTYEQFSGRYELYHLLDEAVESKEKGEHMDYDDFIVDLRAELT